MERFGHPRLLRIEKRDFLAMMQEDCMLANKLLWSFVRGMAETMRVLSHEVVSFSSRSGLDAESTIVDRLP